MSKKVAKKRKRMLAPFFKLCKVGGRTHVRGVCHLVHPGRKCGKLRGGIHAKNPVITTGHLIPTAQWGGVLTSPNGRRRRNSKPTYMPVPPVYLNRRSRKNPLEILPWIVAGGASGAAAAAAARGMNKLLGPPRARNPLGAMLAIVGNPGGKRGRGRLRVSFSPATQAWSLYRGKKLVTTSRDPEHLHYLMGGANIRGGGRHVYPRRAARRPSSRPLTAMFENGRRNPFLPILAADVTSAAIVRGLKGRKRGRNPLSREEAAKLLKISRRIYGDTKVPHRVTPRMLGYTLGKAQGYAGAVWRYGPTTKSRRAADHLEQRIVRTSQSRLLGMEMGPGYSKNPRKGKATFKAHKRGCKCVYHAALRKRGRRRGRNCGTAMNAVRLTTRIKAKPKGPFLPSSISFGNPRTKLGKFLSRKIKKLRHEGYPTKQAVAIAYSYARRAGLRVPARPRSKAKNPGRRSSSSGKKPRKVTVSIDRARRMGMPDFEWNLREFSKFNKGRVPSRVTVWVVNDGKKAVSKESGYVLGRAPEVHYLGTRGSVKEGTHWVHKTKQGREPTLVHVPRTKVTHLMGGAMKVSGRGTSWLHD